MTNLVDILTKSKSEIERTRLLNKFTSIIRVTYENTMTNLADILTKSKSEIERARLLNKFTY